MRAIWSGSIGFGLVNIPIKLYSATQSSRLDLDLLSKNDHARIRYSRVNEETGKEVKWKDVVKGYKVKGDYVVLEDEDFERANAKKTQLIAIENFIETQEIESIYYEKPYYLEPEKGSAKAYSLLLEALKSTGKVGVTRFVLRKKELFAILKPMGNVIVLNKIRFTEEIRDVKELNIPTKKTFTQKELKMAESLIEQFSSKFDISDYKDTYTEELLKVIKAKASGKTLKLRKVTVEPTKSKDLMAQLKASMGKGKKAA